MGLVFDRIRDLNRALDAGDRTAAAAMRAELSRAGVALGLLDLRADRVPAGHAQPADAIGPASARTRSQAAIAARNDARKRRDFAEADAIRGRLRDQGIVLEDRADGSTIWKPA